MIAIDDELIGEGASRGSPHGSLSSDIFDVLLEAHQFPIFLQGDYARQKAQALAACASLGWITTLNLKTKAFGRTWMITPEGFAALMNRENYTNGGSQ